MKTLLILTTSLLILLGYSFPSELKTLHNPNPSPNTSSVSDSNISQLVDTGNAEKRRIAVNAFTPRKIRIMSTEFSLDRGSMDHILRRHHCAYWDGSTKVQQTFFRGNMTVEDIANAIESVMQQNENPQKLNSIGRNGIGQVRGDVNGIRYVVGVKTGRVGQFYPVNSRKSCS